MPTLASSLLVSKTGHPFLTFWQQGHSLQGKLSPASLTTRGRLLRWADLYILDPVLESIWSYPFKLTELRCREAPADAASLSLRLQVQCSTLAAGLIGLAAASDGDEPLRITVNTTKQPGMVGPTIPGCFVVLNVLLNHRAGPLRHCRARPGRAWAGNIMPCHCVPKRRP